MSAKILRIAAVFTILLMTGIAAVQFTSYQWPTTEGVILQAGWDAELNLSHRGSSEYHASYRYVVGGKTYENSTFSFGPASSVVTILNTKEERQPREDDRVTVFYAPFYPGISVLQPGPAANLWIWGVVSVLVAVMLWMVAGVMHEPVI